MSCLENIALPLEDLKTKRQTIRTGRHDEFVRTSIYPRYFAVGKHDSPWSDYLERVNGYKSRSLSLESDALDAFAGVARVASEWATHLRLYGWVINLQVPTAAFDTENSEQVSCGYFELENSELVIIAINAKRKSEDIIMNGDRASITCILLLSWPEISVLSRDHRRYFSMGLAMRPQAGSQSFERLGTITLHLEGLPTEVDDVRDFENRCPGSKFSIPYTRETVVLQ